MKPDRFILLTQAVWIFFNCSLFDINQNQKLVTTPAEPWQILGENDTVSVTFPEEVDCFSVQQIMGITGAAEGCKIFFQWEGRTVQLLVDQPFTPGIEYTLEFRGFYDSIEGESREADVILPFYYLSDDYTPLRVLSVEPVQGAAVFSSSPVIITFNRMPDQAEIIKNLSLSPAGQYDFRFYENTLTLLPREQWDKLTLYTLKIDRPAVDPVWESSFSINDGTGIPRVTLAGTAENDYSAGFPLKNPDTDNVEFQDVLRIHFSEDMDGDSVEKAFRLSPSLSGDFYQVGLRSFVFVPAHGWIMNETYEFLVGEDAESTAGIPLEGNFQTAFAPRIPEMKLDSLECISTGILLTEYNTSVFVDLPGHAVSPYDLVFRLTFSEPFQTEQEKQSAQDTVHLYEIFSSDGNPREASFSWINDYTLTILYSGFYASSDRDHFYLFEIPGGPQGLRNQKGSYMAGSVGQLFRSRL